MKRFKLKYLFIIILITLLVFLFFNIKSIYDSISNKGEVKTLMTIDKYGYTLNEYDSDYFKSLFEELKKCLEGEKVDEEEYAKLVSSLFVTDFYSLEHAISKSDVGGIQFVYTDYQASFTKKAKDTVYAYVKSNVYGKRNQELPNVIEVEVKSIEQENYKGDKIQDKEAYTVELNVKYEKDLDYPDTITLTLAHVSDKLEIVKMD